ncbi:MAG TPA: hypothetical protein PLW81_00355 [Thiobacillaceae bacterium]|nr:hypothetical protein [Thiobacillaceae bacterium]
MNRKLRVKTNKSCDYKKWVVEYDLWPVPQAIYILLGLEPPDLQDILKVNIEVRDDDPTWEGDGVFCSSRPVNIGKWEDFDQLWDRLLYGISSQQLRTYAREGVDYVAPSHLMYWAAQVRLEAPDELRRLIFINKLKYDVDQIENLVKDYDSVKQKNLELESSNKQHKKMYDIQKSRMESAYLHLIGALLDYIKGKFPDGAKHPKYKTNEVLIDDIRAYYGEYYGIARRTIEEKFARAQKYILNPSASKE